MKSKARNGKHASMEVDSVIGADRFFSNILSGWVAHFVVLVVGLVIPRLISDTLGQASLGVWDFGWATVKYLAVSNFGIAAALGRYTAMYRAGRQTTRLAAAISSVIAFQTFLTIAVAVVLVGLYFVLPNLLPVVLQREVSEIQMVVSILGAAFVVQLLAGPARGILSGHHQWKINNIINASSDIASAILMIGVLTLGGGLRDIAYAFLAATICAECVRLWLASKYVQDIRIKFVGLSLSHAMEMVRFGVKTSIMALPMLIALQTTNILLAASVGAAALAIFSRPLALAMQINTLVSKFALILTPMTSSLIGLGDSKRIGRIFVHSLRLSFILSGLMLSALFVFGDFIIQLWMGRDYVNSHLVKILSIGMYLPIAMSAVLQILAGLNAHGRAALIGLMVTVLTYIVAFFVLVPEQGLDAVMAVTVISLALTAGLGISVPIFAVRKIGLDFKTLAIDCVLLPTVPVIFGGIIMHLIQHALPKSPLTAMVLAVSIAMILHAFFWWFVLSTSELQSRVWRQLQSIGVFRNS